MPESVAAAAVVEVPAEAVEAAKPEELPIDDPTAGNENIVAGPEQELSQYSEKKLKAVFKEGGKRGVEIEGAADMGGLQFFCTMMGDLCEGNKVLLTESMKKMNATSDPTEEERKGGAGKLGKMIFSYTEESLAAVAYVPLNFTAGETPQISAKEWLQEVVLQITGQKAMMDEVVTFEGISDLNYAAVELRKDSQKNILPIKMRDPAITMANNYLRSRGLFPEDDDEDEDEMVFGDDDFDM